MEKQNLLYAMKYYSAQKEAGNIETRATTWDKTEDSLLSEIIQTQKHVYDVTHMRYLEATLRQEKE